MRQKIGGESHAPGLPVYQLFIDKNIRSHPRFARKQGTSRSTAFGYNEQIVINRESFVELIQLLLKRVSFKKT